MRRSPLATKLPGAFKVLNHPESALSLGVFRTSPEGASMFLFLRTNEAHCLEELDGISVFEVHFECPMKSSGLKQTYTSNL